MQYAGCIANSKILFKGLLLLKGTFQLMDGDKHIHRISQAYDTQSSKRSFEECYPFPLTKRKVLLRYGSELLQMQSQNKKEYHHCMKQLSTEFLMWLARSE